MTTEASTPSIKFTDEQIADLAKFFDVLRRIHVRLVTEGYVIKDGSIEKPANKYDNSKGKA